MFATTVLNEIPRTKDGYYLVPFREIHEKYVQWDCHYRHINPSQLEEEVGSHVISHEVVVEQDDTLHEKKFRFEYVNENKVHFSDEELKSFTEKQNKLSFLWMRHPHLIS